MNTDPPKTRDEWLMYKYEQSGLSSLLRDKADKGAIDRESLETRLAEVEEILRQCPEPPKDTALTITRETGITPDGFCDPLSCWFCHMPGYDHNCIAEMAGQADDLGRIRPGPGCPRYEND